MPQYHHADTEAGAASSGRYETGRGPISTGLTIGILDNIKRPRALSIIGPIIKEPMRRIPLTWCAAALALVCLIGLPGLHAATSIMPISEVRPGMVGIGRTV